MAKTVKAIRTRRKPAGNRRRMDATEAAIHDLAHGMNSCLGVVRGYIEMALADIPKDSRPYSDLKQAIAGVKDTAGLLKKIYTDIFRLTDISRK